MVEHLKQQFSPKKFIFSKLLNSKFEAIDLKIKIVNHL